MENEQDYTKTDCYAETDCYMDISCVEVFHIIFDNVRNIFVVTLCCVLVAVAYVFTQPKPVVSYTSEALLRIKQMPNIMQTSRRNESVHSSMSEQSGGSATDGLTDGLTDGQAMPVVDNASVPYRSTSQTTNQNTSENWSTSKSESKSESIDQSISSAGYGTLNLNQRMLTYSAILKSKSIMAKVAKELGTSGSVAAIPVKDTEMVNVSFTANNAEKAQKGNELLIAAFQKYVAQKEQASTRYAVNNQAVDTQNFGENATAEVIITSHVDVEVVDSPTHPGATVEERKSPVLILSFGVLMGILLGSVYAIVHAMMNRKITTRQDVEDYIGLPVLTVVPEESSLAEAIARQNRHVGGKSVWQKIGGLLWKEKD